MSNDQTYDLIIVGGGPGGLSAGIYAMRAALKTVLIEKGVAGGQVTMSDEVENYPGFKHTSGAELSMQFVQHVEAYGMEMRNQEVTEIEPGLDWHKVHLDDGQVLRAHAVIMASGGTPRKLGIPGEDDYYGKGVSYCAVCDGFFFKDKTVIVVGGGDTATEEALYLAKLARKVYIAHRRDAFRASKILQKRVLDDCKIEVLWNTVLTEVLADEAGVVGVRLQDTLSAAERQLDVDGVFVFIGFEPNNQIVPAGIRMNADGYVMTTENCETAINGIYAIGDLREKTFRQIVISAADGAVAALASAHHVEMRKGSPDFCEAPADMLA